MARGMYFTLYGSLRPWSYATFMLKTKKVRTSFAFPWFLSIISLWRGYNYAIECISQYRGTWVLDCIPHSCRNGTKVRTFSHFPRSWAAYCHGKYRTMEQALFHDIWGLRYVIVCQICANGNRRRAAANWGQSQLTLLQTEDNRLASLIQPIYRWYTQ